MFSRFPSGSTNPGFVPFCSQIVFHCLRLLLFSVTWNNLCFRKLAREVGQEEARWSCKAKEWVGKSFLDACRGGSWPRRGRHGTLLWREDLVIEWLQGVGGEEVQAGKGVLLVTEWRMRRPPRLKRRRFEEVQRLKVVERGGGD